MGEKELDELFEEAVRYASNPELKLAPDVRLAFYAYYKRAYGISHPGFGGEDSSGGMLVKGFKMNALFQTRSLSIREAKENYIELARKYVPKFDKKVK